jgi:hypothetical protein
MGTGSAFAMGTGSKPEQREKNLEMRITLFQEDAPAPIRSPNESPERVNHHDDASN